MWQVDTNGKAKQNRQLQKSTNSFSMFTNRQNKRKEIYRHLKDSVHGSLSLDKITDDLKLGKRLVSYNLKELQEEKLVTQYKLGTKVIYKAL